MLTYLNKFNDKLTIVKRDNCLSVAIYTYISTGIYEKIAEFITAISNLKSLIKDFTEEF